MATGSRLFSSQHIMGQTETSLIDDQPRQRHLDLPEWFKVSFLDLREDLFEALQSDKRALAVYFGQENCAYCEALLETNFGDPEIARYTRAHFDVVPIDIWGDLPVTDIQGETLTERDFSVMLGTNFTPSLVFFGPGGNEIFRLRGYYPPYRFRAALEYVAGYHYLRESFRDYLERADPPPKFERDDLNQQAFFMEPPYLLDRSHFSANRPLSVFFEQPSCHACDLLHTALAADERSLHYCSLMDAVQLDMWSDTPVLTPQGRRLVAREWASQLGIHYAPTVVFFDGAGQEIFRIDSVVRAYRLSRVLQYVAERGYETGLNYQQWHGKRRLVTREE